MGGKHTQTHRGERLLSVRFEPKTLRLAVRDLAATVQDCDKSDFILRS